ncbi:MAG: hypothetical protein U0401_02560 [Anaerolineae bacterium]
MYEYELELEALPELEEEYEYEGEWEGEFESEEFFRRLAGLARRAVQSPALRRVGLTAARTALRAGLGPQVGGLVGNLLPQSEFEGEFEWEAEGEAEWEEEVNPIRRVYPDALMEHLGHAAAEAESEAEAEAFIGALVPLAARLIPRVAPAIMRAAPRLIRGATRVVRALRRSPTTRPLVRTLPTVVRRTAVSMARQAAQGRPVTPQAAVRTLARQTAQVLGSPQQSVQAWRHSCALDRRYHRAVRPARTRVARPAVPRC